ncbi:MAG: hypothetical protein ACLTAI_12955 [Thomasclavelia sp.]
MLNKQKLIQLLILDELKLNGTNIEDFEGFDGYNEETKTYTVNLKTADYPTVEASALKTMNQSQFYQYITMKLKSL